MSMRKTPTILEGSSKKKIDMSGSEPRCAVASREGPFKNRQIRAREIHLFVEGGCTANSGNGTAALVGAGAPAEPAQRN